MLKIFRVVILIFSIQSFGQVEPSYQIELPNAVGSALVGLAIGATASTALLVKDATCGILVKGGKEFWGRDRALPLLILTTLPAGIFGYLGHMHQVNFLTVLWTEGASHKGSSLP